MKNKNPTDPERKALLTEAGAWLAVHMVEAVNQRQRGNSLPEPNRTEITSAEQVADALGAFAVFLDLDKPDQRARMISLFAMLADCLSEQGAELEGILHTRINPDEPMRKAMVMRMKAPDVGS